MLLSLVPFSKCIPLIHNFCAIQIECNNNSAVVGSDKNSGFKFIKMCFFS